METEANRKRSFELSPSQTAICLGQELHPHLPIYNTAYAFRFQQAIDANAFERAHSRLIESTDALRIILAPTGGAFAQRVLEKSPGALRLENCETMSEATFKKLLASETASPLDPTICPWRSTLFKRTEGIYVWHLLHHHLFTDALSFQIILERTATFYRQAIGLSPKSERAPFPSFENWLSKARPVEKAESRSSEPISETFAHSRLYSASIPSGNPNGERREIPLPKSLNLKLQTFLENPNVASFSTDLSLSHVFLAAVIALLSRIERASEIRIGFATHGRSTPEARQIAGHFIEILELDAYVDPLDTFFSLLEKVRSTYFARARATERDLAIGSRTQRFDVVLNLITGKTNDFGGIPVEAEWLYPGCHESANRWRIHVDTTNGIENLKIIFDFNDEAFSLVGKDSAIANFLTTLETFVDSPNALVQRYPLVGLQSGSVLRGDELKQPAVTNLWARFKTCAESTPDAIAIRAPEGEYSFRELLKHSIERRAPHFAGQPELSPAIPVVGQQSADFVIACLAALRAGRAFLPIDSNLPAERIATIIADSGGDPDPRLAYVMYTSGSTGIPNGVVVGHESVIYLLEDMERRAPLPLESRCMWWTAVGFDVSIYEVYSSLLYGRTLCIPPAECRLNAYQLFDWMERQAINSAYLPPLLLEDFHHWLRITDRSLPLKRLLVGVEPIQEQLLASIARRVDGLQIVNGYGPTETTVCATLYNVRTDFCGSRRTPIGNPVAGSRCYVLDHVLNLMPAGAVGELYVSGKGLAKGYLNRSDLTRSRFVPNPFATDDDHHALMYKTGDLVCVNDAGELEFIGRTDSQLKLRGTRVEPAEIEQAILTVGSIDRCVVRVSRIRGQDELVCYYSGESPIASDRLLVHATRHLPFQLLPKRFVHLRSFPTTVNDKIDYQKLPAGEPDSISECDASRPPEGPLEEALAQIWSETLKQPLPGTTRTFFELGGSSLAAMETVFRISDTFGIPFNLQNLLQNPTIAAVASVVERLIQESIDELPDDEVEKLLNSASLQ